MQGRTKWVKLSKSKHNSLFNFIIQFDLGTVNEKTAATNYVIQLNEYQTENNCQKYAFFPKKKMTKFLLVIYFWNNLILHSISYSVFPDHLQIVPGLTNACEKRYYLSILLRYSLHIWFTDIKLYVKQFF